LTNLSFGPVIKKWWAFMNTEEAVVAQQMPVKRDWARLKSLVIAASIASACMIMSIAWAWTTCGSIERAVDYYLRGRTLILDSHEKSFGTTAPGARSKVSFRLTNWDSEPIRILGCQSSCTCLIRDDLPFAIPAGETRDFSVAVTVPEGAVPLGLIRLHYEMTLFTNIPNQSRILLRLEGEVDDTSSMSGG
jgi:hypothetical protein